MVAEAFAVLAADGGFLTASPFGCLDTTVSIALKISVPRAFIHDGVSAGGAASASATFLATAALRSASAAERLSARSAASRCRSTRLASFSSGVNGGGSDALRTRRRRRSLTISR